MQACADSVLHQLREKTRAVPSSAARAMHHQYSLDANFLALLEAQAGPLVDLCPLKPDWDPRFHWDGLAHAWPKRRCLANVPFDLAQLWLSKALVALSHGTSSCLIVPKSQFAAWRLTVPGSILDKGGLIHELPLPPLRFGGLSKPLRQELSLIWLGSQLLYKDTPEVSL